MKPNERIKLYHHELTDYINTLKKNGFNKIKKSLIKPVKESFLKTKGTNLAEYKQRAKTPHLHDDNRPEELREVFFCLAVNSWNIVCSFN